MSMSCTAVTGLTPFNDVTRPEHMADWSDNWRAVAFTSFSVLYPSAFVRLDVGPTADVHSSTSVTRGAIAATKRHQMQTMECTTADRFKKKLPTTVVLGPRQVRGEKSPLVTGTQTADYQITN